MMKLCQELWPLPRSITGNAVRESYRILNQYVPITLHEFPTGLQCFDWTIPKEWNIRTAKVTDTRGNVLIDFADHNLHVVSYSTPIKTRISRDELFKHLHSRADLPDAIPYRTSYYAENWGFCIEHNKRDLFTDDEYDVEIDSTLEDGSLTIGEGYIQGESDQEILLSTYFCHPSMANNELSGPVALAKLYKTMLERPKPRYSYRFVWAPETIGSIVYLSQNYKELQKSVVAGYTLAMVGIDDPLIYRETRHNDCLSDRAARNLIDHDHIRSSLKNWSPMGGGDQRQYCSIGIDLAIGYFTRAMDGSYPEYHTSLDDLGIISEERLQEAVDAILSCLDVVEQNRAYTNTNPCCEPQLGKRGLYPTMGGETASQELRKYINILGYSDGQTDLLEIANHMGLPACDLFEAAKTLENGGLLKA